MVNNGTGGQLKYTYAYLQPKLNEESMINYNA